MKFYIASRVKNKKLVKNIHKKLTDCGHKVLSNWVDIKDIIPYEANVDASKRFAAKCIKNSSNCDVFVLVSDETGAGMYTELGAALLANIIYNKPKIYIIGDYLNRSMFFFHPKVRKFKSIDEVLEDLK